VPATKIVLQIFVAGALFFEVVTSVPAVYSILGGARGRMSGHVFFKLSQVRRLLVSNQWNVANYNVRFLNVFSKIY